MLVHDQCQSHRAEQARRAIQITRELLVGTTGLVRNKRGTQISARVVSQINAEHGLLKYETDLWKRTSDPLPSGELRSQQRERA
jgi:hypothetical protein